MSQAENILRDCFTRYISIQASRQKQGGVFQTPNQGVRWMPSSRAHSTSVAWAKGFQEARDVAFLVERIRNVAAWTRKKSLSAAWAEQDWGRLLDRSNQWGTCAPLCAILASLASPGGPLQRTLDEPSSSLDPEANKRLWLQYVGTWLNNICCNCICLVSSITSTSFGCWFLTGLLQDGGVCLMWDRGSYHACYVYSGSEGIV